MSLWRNLRLLLGVADFRDECARTAEEAYGKDNREEFLRLYDAINRFESVSLIEALAVAEIVNGTKDKLKEKTLMGRLGKLKKKSQENNNGDN